MIISDESIEGTDVVEPPQTRRPADQSGPRLFDAVVVGAGFAGLYMLHRLRRIGLTAKLFEAGDGVGGTWYWNRYPGARCDVESMQYSYSFSDALQQEWTWSEKFSAQPEILKYLNHVADRFDLRRDIALSTRVNTAAYQATTGHWRIETDRGGTIEARFCIMATGCLSSARIPDIEGLGQFGGHVYHTGNWPHQPVDFSGQAVGVIGTGSSGIQVIPVVAEQARHLYVFQRTANYSVPARNMPLTRDRERLFKDNYAEMRQRARTSRSGTYYEWGAKSALAVSPEERAKEYEARWGVQKGGGASFLASFSDLLTSKEANDTAAEFVRAKIRSIVHDPKVADTLTPKDHPFGAKRLPCDTHYFETFNRPNVTLVDLRQSPIERITTTGIQTENAHFALDSIVFATGFDAMTGALTAVDIRGTDGETLRQRWTVGGPRTYLGLMSAGFPNLFTITGPGSPSVLSNVVVSIEQHVDWIADCLIYMRERGFRTIEATPEAQDEWATHVNDVAAKTLLPQANSWYMGANIPGKPRVFMPYVGGVPAYRKICDDVAAQDYRGFRLRHELQADPIAARSEQI